MEGKALELNILIAIQKISSSFFDAIFIFLTQFGEIRTFAVLLPIVYWCMDKGLGERLFISLFASSYTNGFIKGLVVRPRPIGQNGVRTIYSDSATSSSFPSGHSQSSASFFGVAAFYKGIKKWWWLLIIPVLTGVSRLYLGVHWPTDVLAGLLIGAAIALIVNFAMKLSKKATLIALPVICAVLLVFTKGAEHLADCLLMLGLLLGASIGILIENSFIDFTTHDVKLLHRLLRIPVGLIAVAIPTAIIALPLWLLGVSPTGDYALAGLACCVAFSATVLAPLSFRALRLE